MKFPTSGKSGDVIYFRANLNKRCTIYYTVASSYSNSIVRSGTAGKSVKLNITYPEQVYLTITSTSTLALDYNIYLWGAVGAAPNNTNNNTNPGTNNTNNNTNPGTNNTNNNTNPGTNNTNNNTNPGTNNTNNNTNPGTNNTNNNTNPGGNNTNNNTNPGTNNTNNNTNPGGGSNNNTDRSGNNGEVQSEDSEVNIAIIIAVPVVGALLITIASVIFIRYILKKKRQKK